MSGTKYMGRNLEWLALNAWEQMGNDWHCMCGKNVELLALNAWEKNV